MEKLISFTLEHFFVMFYFFYSSLGSSNTNFDSYLMFKPLKHDVMLLKCGNWE